MSDSSESSGSSSGGGSWLSQAKDWVLLNMDNSRIERLQHCRVLQETLAECRKASKNNNANKERLQLEHTPSGIRMLNFFKWRNLDDYHSNCQREEHALWGCRAVALQCGAELNQVKLCFDREQKLATDGNPINPGVILFQKRTAYESGEETSDSNIPCREYQEQMGKCIRESSTALAKRHLERSGKDNVDL